MLYYNTTKSTPPTITCPDPPLGFQTTSIRAAGIEPSCVSAGLSHHAAAEICSEVTGIKYFYIVGNAISVHGGLALILQG